MNRKKIMLIAVLMVGLLAFVACGEEAAGDAMYVDGTYTGTGDGYGGELVVEVTIENDEITGIEVVSHSETEGLGDAAFEPIIDQVIEDQGTQDVDAVSGATETSNALIDAIDEALAQAVSPGDGV